MVAKAGPRVDRIQDSTTRSASVVIAAHNEEAVIGGCLDAVLRQTSGCNLEVVVSANGCTDQTVEVARRRSGVKVLDRPESGKAAALNAADAVAESYPRIYLDADIVMPTAALDELLNALDGQGTVVAVPKRRVNTQGRPLAVKGYFAVNERLPAFKDGLFGRGMIAVTRAGRESFGAFPLMVADDLFLDSVFDKSERTQVDRVEVVVEAPYRTADLVRRLVRVRRGNAQMREAARVGQVSGEVRGSDRWAWLRSVVASEPRVVLAAVPYVGLTLLATLLSRHSDDAGWGRDESTRVSRVSVDGAAQ